MILLLALLMATGAPPVHRASAKPSVVSELTVTSEPTPTPTPSRPPVDPEERRIADATVGLAQMTGLLAVVTTAAVLVPIWLARGDRAREKAAREQEKIAALRHLMQVVVFFRSRAQRWSDELGTAGGDAYLDGLDVALASSFSDETLKAVGPTTGTVADAIGALMTTYDQMVRVASAQNRLSLKGDLQNEITRLNDVRERLKGELSSLGVDLP
jgi:hypothetical protein